MEYTISQLEEFLDTTDSYNALSFELVIDILGEDGANEFRNTYQLEFDEEDEIPWDKFSSYDVFEEMCHDDDFIALIGAYFDEDITII